MKYKGQLNLPAETRKKSDGTYETTVFKKLNLRQYISVIPEEMGNK